MIYPTYPELNDVTIVSVDTNNSTITVDFSIRNLGWCVFTAVVDAELSKGSREVGYSADPQYSESEEFDLLQVDSNSIATIDCVNFDDEVSAVNGLKFKLTWEQIADINSFVVEKC